MNPVIAALLGTLKADAKTDPAKAIAELQQLAALLSNPLYYQLAVAGLPLKTRQILMADPDGVIASVNAEITVLAAHPRLLAALALAV